MRAAETIAACLICAALGFILGRSPRKESPRQEPPAVAIRHQDGSLTLERTQEPPPPPLPEPPGTIARTRAAIIELEPITTRSEIQIDLVTLKDGTQRITANGPGITGGRDFPIRPPQTVKKWTVGPAWGTSGPGIVAIYGVNSWSAGFVAQRDRTAVFLGFRF